jgi:hypothetical protein
MVIGSSGRLLGAGGHQCFARSGPLRDRRAASRPSGTRPMSTEGPTIDAPAGLNDRLQPRSRRDICEVAQYVRGR